MFPIWYRDSEGNTSYSDYREGLLCHDVSYLAISAVYLRLALLGKFKDSLSFSLPVFLWKVSSCIVFLTQSYFRS